MATEYFALLVAQWCLAAVAVASARISFKAGLSYNDPVLLETCDPSHRMAWGYNWDHVEGGSLPLQIEYIPMLWNTSRSRTSGWSTDVESALARGSTHLLAFNEPDLEDQANMDPTEAAQAYRVHMNHYHGQAQLGSPAVTNGEYTPAGAPMGLRWMQQFFDACAGQCLIDFMAIHWYGGAADPNAFKTHVEEAAGVARQNHISRLWITEFRGGGTLDEEVRFIRDVIPWLDANDDVERYAYFMCADGYLLSGNEINAAGTAYEQTSATFCSCGPTEP